MPCWVTAVVFVSIKDPKCVNKHMKYLECIRSLSRHKSKIHGKGDARILCSKLVFSAESTSLVGCHNIFSAWPSEETRHNYYKCYIQLPLELINDQVPRWKVHQAIQRNFGNQ